MQSKRGLYQKILNVMKEINAVAKDKVNNFHNYAYTSEAAILKAVREPMIKNGLIAIPLIEEERVERVDKNTIVTIKYCLKVIDTDTGEYENVVVIGQGIDTGDKAFYKAITGCNKYALMKLFQIPSIDDPEAEEQENDENNEPLTEAQRKYIRKLVDQNGIEYEKVKEFIKRKYGKISSKELTKREASELIELLKEKGDLFNE